MTTSTRFVQAIHINNHAVHSLLDCNDNDESNAIRLFTSSITLLKDELAAISSIPSGKGSTITDSPAAASSNEMPSFVKLPMQQHHGSVVDQECSIAFNQALMIPVSSSSLRDIEVYTAAVIFNLALVHQRKGIKLRRVQGGSAAATALKMKATKLYSMVLQLLSNHHSSSSSAIQSFEVLVKLATVNNLSEIQFEIGQGELAINEITKVLSSLQQRNGMDMHAFENPDVTCLLLNVLLMKAPTNAPAA